MAALAGETDTGEPCEWQTCCFASRANPGRNETTSVGPAKDSTLVVPQNLQTMLATEVCSTGGNWLAPGHDHPCGQCCAFGGPNLTPAHLRGLKPSMDDTPPDSTRPFQKLSATVGRTEALTGVTSQKAADAVSRLHTSLGSSPLAHR